MKSKKIVVIGFVGTQLDSGKGSGRWEKWRPTVALMQHEEMMVDRLELLYSGKHEALVEQVSKDINAVSPETTIKVSHLPITDPWDFEEVYGCLFDFARSFHFDTENEEYWIHITTGTHVVQICMYLLTEAFYFPGRLLQTSPSRRQVIGDPGSYTLIDLDLSKYDQIAQRFSREQEERVAFLKSGISTRNARFNSMIDEIERVAIKSKAPMLLMGPTGAGKSFLAKRVFELKKTRHKLQGKFVEINCATMHGDGAASTLFGHTKGAFTGAASDRPGLLRAANKGLLFLDEIGELGLDEQAMLLMAIEEKRFLPVGSDHEVQSDFQLIAGTNRDLSKEVIEGRFREDLYARINLWSYELPSLVERLEDIEPNIDYLLAQFSAEQGQMVRFNKEAREHFMRFATSREAIWKGNFRDLSASITRMATLADSGRVTDTVVSDEIVRLKKLWQHYEHDDISNRVDLSKVLAPQELENLDLFDAMQLTAVLDVCKRSKSISDAGRKLYAASRSAKEKPNDADRLKKYLAKFGLSWNALF
ncbi:RNA repair transcriptional activator RtcR [Undibacterium macrobrachii]|jgi:transcriptional regulatory protein RtcR|uniref:Transcriptional regulator n=1 Tax=Undibacterium macrobrachii TaxID=1119058 RepID=A0ABQ2XLA0_9BURK|nr:RNA repair transcriptional activator RtcR [Undibacterium macrobrachii]GGX22414.1 transcriptional regulator [Undibacterium macrobrachii]